MIHLRQELTKLLKKYNPQVYYHDASSKAKYPYIVYSLPNSLPIEEQEVFVLDIDIWDNKDDTTVVETLASTLWKALNKHNHVDSNIQFSIHRENRLPPLDEKENKIRRRKLIFSLRYFDRRIYE
ncbi:hypothetical protein [Sporosarcina sp. OR05]|uniref:hypothetical protein n=1 Tax=Sporosarcina sp. OR05 TaxID=2969819 RepID=UPI00352B3309